VKSVDIVGKGFAFPFRFTNMGRVNRMTGVSNASSSEKVSMAIRQILGTKIGSRVMDRDFGSDLREILFTPIDEVSIARVRFAITSAIQTWEKRIDLLSVDIDTSRVKEGLLDVGIQFKIISTQQLGSLVYPLYLTEEMVVSGQLNV
jgi:phage baseplate assembly protein W